MIEVLKITNLGKAYNKTDTYVDSLFLSLFKRKSIPSSFEWVIRNVTFSAYAGEVIGVVGINGAGKSTLLSMISGSIIPSEGEIIKNGEISSILELGMGFDPNFTGRQNVELQARINNIGQQQIKNEMLQIQAFADIGSYFDRNISTYSSGMLARLAFATSTIGRPDILIIDEAISVGDISFQAKCMQKINDLKKQGTCILLVTHTLNLVREFCDKALYLSNNTMKAFGEVDYVCDNFQNDIIEPSNTTQFVSKKTSEKIQICNANPDLRKYSSVKENCGTMQLEFIDFYVMNSYLKKTTHINYNEKIIFNATIKANQDILEGTAVGLLVADKNGYHLFCCNSNHYNKYLPNLSKNQVINISWSFLWPFRQGEFRIDIGMKPDPFGNIFYDRIFTACTLITHLEGKLINKNFGGYLFLEADIDIK